jgi:hypothetical protein
MITITTNRLMLLAGAILLVAIGLVFPLEAFANNGIQGVTTDTTAQAKTLGSQLQNIPKLIAMGSYVIGAFFAVRALFALKGFIEKPDDNPITSVLGFGAVATLLILLPYILGVLATSMGAKNATVNSSASSFQDTGF